MQCDQEERLTVFLALFCTTAEGLVCCGKGRTTTRLREGWPGLVLSYGDRLVRAAGTMVKSKGRLVA